MPLHIRAFLALVFSLFALTFGHSRAAAYCQTTTAEQTNMECPGECITTGFPLAWPSARIKYVFNEKGFPGFDTASLRTVFKGVFDRWQAVNCDGAPVGLDVVAEAETTNLTVGPADDEPNANVISHLSAEEWQDTGNDSQAFALTAIWYDTLTGRILGADMYFNGGMDPFAVCPESGCVDKSTDLPNVAVHEAGHFFGLAHSEVPDSTMWCDAKRDETNKRSLAADDETGLCAAYPPGEAYTDDLSRERNPSCGCRVGPSPRASFAGVGAFSLLAIGLFLRRRPARASRWVKP